MSSVASEMNSLKNRSRLRVNVWRWMAEFLEENFGFCLHLCDHSHMVQQGACHAWVGLSGVEAVEDFLHKTLSLGEVALGELGFGLVEFFAPLVQQQRPFVAVSLVEVCYGFHQLGTYYMDEPVEKASGNPQMLVLTEAGKRAGIR